VAPISDRYTPGRREKRIDQIAKLQEAGAFELIAESFEWEGDGDEEEEQEG
jgi:hypothetical protein